MSIKIPGLAAIKMLALIPCLMIAAGGMAAAKKDADFDRAAAERRVQKMVQALDAWNAALHKLSVLDSMGDKDVTPEREAVRKKRPNMDMIRDDLLGIIAVNPTDDLAFKTIKATLKALEVKYDQKAHQFATGTPNARLHKQMAQLLMDHHMQRPEIFEVMNYLRMSRQAKAGFWQRLYESSPNRNIRGNAAMLLVEHNLFQLHKFGLGKAERKSLRDKGMSFVEAIRTDYADVIPDKSVRIPRSMSVPGKDRFYRGPESPRLGALLGDRLNALAYSVGDEMPNLKVARLDGSMDQLANYKGKVVLLDFWATWCGNCVKGHPHLVALKQKMAGRPFEIIGVSGDQGPEDVVEYLEEELDLPWVQWYSDRDDDIWSELSIRGLPTYFLVDADGTIQARGQANIIVDEFDAYIDKLVTQVERRQ